MEPSGRPCRLRGHGCQALPRERIDEPGSTPCLPVSRYGPTMVPMRPRAGLVPLGISRREASGPSFSGHCGIGRCEGMQQLLIVGPGLHSAASRSPAEGDQLIFQPLSVAV